MISNTTTSIQEQDLSLYIQKVPKREEALPGLIYVQYQYILPICPSFTVFYIKYSPLIKYCTKNFAVFYKVKQITGTEYIYIFYN